jgi:hypothetical protein
VYKRCCPGRGSPTPPATHPTHNPSHPLGWRRRHSAPAPPPPPTHTPHTLRSQSIRVRASWRFVWGVRGGRGGGPGTRRTLRCTWTRTRSARPLCSHYWRCPRRTRAWRRSFATCGAPCSTAAGSSSAVVWNARASTRRQASELCCRERQATLLSYRTLGLCPQWGVGGGGGEVGTRAVWKRWPRRW